MAYFPLFGVLVGAWGAVFFQAACVLWPPAIAAGASTLATVWLTGCFHEDGLADCFDGFGGGWGRPQILRIMKDSRVGTYALVGMALALHTKMWALASMQPWDAAAAMVAAHCASRWTSVPLLRACTYLQDEEDAKKGLYNWFAASQRLVTWPRVLLSTGAALAVPYLALGLQRAALVWVTTVVVTAAAGYYGTAILGGVVGDYLGATIQVAEVCAYLALSADWGALAAGWRPILVLCGTVLLPVIYTRRIVDFGVAAC